MKQQQFESFIEAYYKQYDELERKADEAFPELSRRKLLQAPRKRQIALIKRDAYLYDHILKWLTTEQIETISSSDYELLKQRIGFSLSSHAWRLNWLAQAIPLIAFFGVLAAFLKLNPPSIIGIFVAGASAFLLAALNMYVLSVKTDTLLHNRPIEQLNYVLARL